jgi:hypothetical protein
VGWLPAKRRGREQQHHQEQENSMGRPKGAKDTKPRKKRGEGGAEPPPAIGDNSAKFPELTDEQRRVIFLQHKRRWAKLFGERAAADRLLKRAAIEAESAEGEAAIKERMARQARVLLWSGTAVQLDFFTTSTDNTPAIERARAAGELAGMEGETCSPPHDPSVPQHGAWIDGWQRGQSLLIANRIKPLDEPEPVATLIPAAEAETRGVARLAEHDARGEDDEWDDADTVDEAQRRLRQEGAIAEGLDGLAREQAATIGDQPATYREVN